MSAVVLSLMFKMGANVSVTKRKAPLVADLEVRGSAFFLLPLRRTSFSFFVLAFNVTLQQKQLQSRQSYSLLQE